MKLRSLANQCGAAMVELAISLTLLLILAIGITEYGRALLQIMNLSMINLEAALFAGSLNLVPGTNVGNGHAAINYQSQALLTLPGQNSGLGSSPSLNVQSTFTRIPAGGLPESSVLISAATRTSSLYNAPSFLGGLGVDLRTQYVAPNFLGPPLTVVPGFQNPNPLVDCAGNEIPGCTSASCAPGICP